LRAHFRPEFLNRVDEIIIFDRLSEEELKKIVEIQLADCRNVRATKRSRSSCPIPPKALLAREGYDPVYGRDPCGVHSKKFSIRSASIFSKVKSAKVRPLP